MTPTSSGQGTSTATFLVVEDDRTLADLYADVLSRDHRVVVAYTARAAAEQLAAEPDVVLLDQHELFRQLTVDRLTRNLRIVESGGDDLEADPEFHRLQRRIAVLESELAGIEGTVDHDIVERTRTA